MGKQKTTKITEHADEILKHIAREFNVAQADILEIAMQKLLAYATQNNALPGKIRPDSVIYEFGSRNGLVVAEERGEFDAGKSSPPANAPPAQSGSTAHAITAHPGMNAPKDGAQENRKIRSKKGKKLVS